MGDLPQAVLNYLRAGDLKAAAELELRLENREKAAWLFSRSGQHGRAAELLEALDQFEAAAGQYEKAGYREKAAFLYVKAGLHMLAAPIFEKLIETAGKETDGSFRSEGDRSAVHKYHRYCGELYLKSGHPAKAAPHFEAALLPDQAAEAWKVAGQPEKAADILPARSGRRGLEGPAGGRRDLCR
jgi:tetratricopeptide (TPR) repeat protein